MTRWVAAALGVAALVITAPGDATGAPRKPAPRVGSQIVFHGWSPNSRFVLYERIRYRKGRRPTSPLKRQSSVNHRGVTQGTLGSYGAKVDRRKPAAYAKAHRYVAEAAPLTRLNANRWRVQLDETTHLTLGLSVGEDVGWVLEDTRGVRVAAHIFDRVYVDVTPAVYVSPNGREAVIVMHLDTGWVVDAAIYPVRLPEQLRN